MGSSVTLTKDGVHYVPSDEAIIRVTRSTGLSISGAYRRLADARADGRVRVILISRNQRWFAEDDVDQLVRSIKETA